MSLGFLGSKSFSLNKSLFLGLIGGRGPPEPGIGGLGGSGGLTGGCGPGPGIGGLTGGYGPGPGIGGLCPGLFNNSLNNKILIKSLSPY